MCHIVFIGGGNHFAEFQHVTEVFDKAEFARANLSTDLVYLLVHSGSRRLGGSILDAHTAKYKHAGLDPSSPEGQEYLRQHDNACKWARLNREVIARRVMEKLNADDNALVNDEQRKVEKVLDIWHNSVEKKEWNTGTEQAKQLWVHRKGAAPSDRGLVVIPGSRGACSFLVMPVGDQNENGKNTILYLYIPYQFILRMNWIPRRQRFYELSKYKLNDSCLFFILRRLLSRSWRRPPNVPHRS